MLHKMLVSVQQQQQQQQQEEQEEEEEEEQQQTSNIKQLKSIKQTSVKPLTSLIWLIISFTAIRLPVRMFVCVVVCHPGFATTSRVTGRSTARQTAQMNCRDWDDGFRKNVWTKA